MKNNTKTIIKIVAYLTVFVSLIVGIALISDDSTSEKEDDFTYYLKDSNFPIADYIYIEVAEKEEVKKPVVVEEKEVVAENNYFDEKVQELSLRFSESAYKPDAFQTNAEIEEIENAKKRKRLISYMNSNKSSGNDIPLNKFMSASKILDYGSSSFSNLDIQDVATNETKLYRTITADKRIPIILTEPIESTLDGIVTATIEDDIYASMGLVLLIPKGSKAIGSYKANGSGGMNRFNLAWERIITTNGININLTSAITQDILGFSGVVGEVDNRYWKRYGLPLAMSTLSNGLLLAISSQASKGMNGNNNNNMSLILDNSRQDLAYILKNITDEQIKIKPKITVQAGSRLFIKPKHDIWFPIPKKNEIQVRYFNIIKESKSY